MEHDSGIDGTVDKIVDSHFDLSARLVSERIDDDADGSTDIYRLWRYEGALLVAREARTGDAAGPLRSRSDHEYDAAGRLVRTRSDNDGDGRQDLVFENAYDDGGQLVSSREDWSADGTWDHVTRFEYENGLRKRAVIDLFDDGVVDKYYLYEWTGGLLTRVEVDHVGPDGSDSVETFEYNFLRLLTRRVADFGLDGEIDYEDIFRYDGRGLLSGVRTQSLGAHLGDLSYEYDQNNRLAIEELSSAQYRKNFRYTCPG
jgi:hypothetical protein